MNSVKELDISNIYTPGLENKTLIKKEYNLFLWGIKILNMYIDSKCSIVSQ